MNLPAHGGARVTRNKTHATDARIDAVPLADNLAGVGAAGGHPGGGVVVDSEPAEWLRCHRQPRFTHKGPVCDGGRHVNDILGEPSTSQKVQEDAVLESINQLSLLGDIVILGNDRGEVQHKTGILDPGSLESLDAVTTGHHEAIKDLQAGCSILFARG